MDTLDVDTGYTSSLKRDLFCSRTIYFRWWHWQHPYLTHWGRVTHICVGKLTIIGSDNGLSPGRRQAIIWTNAGILLIGPLGTNFSEIWIAIEEFSFKKMHLKISSGKWRPFCLGLNVLTSQMLRQCIWSDYFQNRIIRQRISRSLDDSPPVILIQNLLILWSMKLKDFWPQLFCWLNIMIYCIFLDISVYCHYFREK